MKNKKVYGLVGVAALAAIGGTFAYYSAEQTFNNPFNTTNYSTSSTERFNPNGDNKNWKPGANVDKDVLATNTGDGDVWVRVKFNEFWNRGEVKFGEFESIDGEFNTSNGITSIQPTGTSDGFTDGDDSVVQKIFANLTGVDGAEVAANKWYFNKNDGYFYFTSSLASNTSTPILLDSVTLSADADMGSYFKPVYYTTGTKGSAIPQFDEAVLKEKLKEGFSDTVDGLPAEIEIEGYTWKWGVPPVDGDFDSVDVFTYKGHILDDEAMGYAAADYELDITVEFLQTTEESEEGDSILMSAGWPSAVLKELGLYGTN